MASILYTPNVFANYNSNDTVNKSGILLGSNRVDYLKLKEVRKYDITGNYTTESSRQLFP